MTRLCAIGCMALLSGCQAEADPAPLTGSGPAVPPVENVILVTIDTLRADMIGSHGGPAKTPVLDSLAARGWVFEQCISASMLTNPSHASIMTSLYPRDHGVYDNQSGVADGVRTLATELQRQGFYTAAVIGFEHLNPGVSNLGQGFAAVVEATRTELRADAAAARALALLDRKGPFFLWLHIVDPHSPYEPPNDHPLPLLSGQARTPLSKARQAAPGFQRHNPWFKRAFATYGSVEHLMQRYIAEIEVADAGLGLLLDGLKRRGLLERTAVVVTSDHGENLGERDLYFHHGGLYSSTIHVPLIVAAPGATAVRIGSQVESVDIAPTVLDLVGVSGWEPMRGRSLVRLVRGQERWRPFVFSEHMLAQQVAVRSARGSLILHRKTTRQFPTYHFVTGTREVYDLRTDAAETQPLDPAGRLGQELSAALRDYLAAGLHLAARPAVDQDRESLRALGYIE